MENLEQPVNQTLNGGAGEELSNTSNQGNSLQATGDLENSVSQVTDNGSKEFGKFKDAQSLLKAYNALQTEFTKKSQRLSELENSNTEFSREEKINRAIELLEQNHSIANKFSKELKESAKNAQGDNYVDIMQEELLKHLEQGYKTAEEYACDQDFLQAYVYSNQEIKDNIIRDYLANLTNATPVKVVSNISSSIPLSPPNQPTTIQEAGRLAKNIIKQI